MVSHLTQKLFSGLLLLFTVAVALAQAPADTQNLTAFVDRNEITLNEILTLTVRVDSSLGNARPSLGGLNRDFEQVGNINTRSSYTNVNGNVQSFVDYIVRLRPRSTGTLTIPALRIGSEVTTPIRVTVGEATQVNPSGNNEIFIMSEVSKDSVYVQEQLLYTIKLYYSISFDQGAQLTSPQVANSVVQQLGSDETFSEIVDGIRYNVTERKFVIFPQSSGELIIPPVYFTATVGRRGGLTRFFNNRTSVREINLASDTHNIEVKGKPASFPAGQTWLPAANLSILESWSGAPDNLGIGDSITRNIQITATGLSSSLLPGITYEEIPGLKFYPDQPVTEDTADELGVTGSRAEGTAIVTSEAGDFVIPELVVYWWNTASDMLEESVIPAQTLKVIQGATPIPNSMPDLSGLQPEPGAFSSGGAATPAPQTSGLYLFWISATTVFAVAWLFSTLMWLRSRQQLAYAVTATPAMTRKEKKEVRQPPASADAALKVLKTAVAKGDPGDIKRCILAWGQALFEDHNLLTLGSIQAHFNDNELDNALYSLEQSLYSQENAGEVDGELLINAISRLHREGKPVRKKKTEYSLPPLYKN